MSEAAANGRVPGVVIDPFDAVLEIGGAALREAMADVEARLREITRIDEYSLGDRRRRRQAPAAAVRVRGRAWRSDARVELSRAAAAVELIHSATLVHDDVLDDAPLRRGSRTVYAAAGRDAATATGDLLFSTAFAELARNGVARAAARAVERLRGAGPRRADAAR